MKNDLDTIIAKQSPAMAKLTREVLAKLRPRFPGAVEMVYDKKRGMVIGFCPDDRASNVINSIGVYSKWINLYFDKPGVKALMAEALKRAHPKLDPKAKRRVLIRQRGK